MNQNVAVHTGATYHRGAWSSIKPSLLTRGIRTYGTGAAMRAVMALLAQERRARLEQRCKVGTMRRVAIVAVLYHRLMLEEEGAALLGMADVTGFRHGVLPEQLRARRTVWVVAVRAHDLGYTARAYIHRVGGKFVAVGSLLFVAGVADASLSLLAQDGVDRLVDCMAVVARNAIDLMLAAVPIRTPGSLMAA